MTLLYAGRIILLHNFDVGTAMLWSFQGRHCCSDGRICIRTGRSNHTGGKRTVITAAMLSMFSIKIANLFRNYL